MPVSNTLRNCTLLIMVFLFTALTLFYETVTAEAVKIEGDLIQGA